MSWRWFVTLMSVLAMAVGTGAAVSPATGGEEGQTRGGEIACGDLDRSTLKVLEPVNLAGPIPTVLREVESGDLVQLQISYPTSAVVPVRACVKVDNRAMTALSISANEGQVAVLTPEPQQGLVGMGYFSAFVQANNEGECGATVTSVMSDGTEKTVPFQFKINARPTQKDRLKAAGRRGTIEVYAHPRALSNKDKLVDGAVSGAKPIDVSSEPMLIWVDLMPEARFAHPTLYVLISGEDAKTVQGQWWPVLNGEPLFRDGKPAAVIKKPIGSR